MPDVRKFMSQVFLKSPDEVLAMTKSNMNGLSDVEAKKRLENNGPNSFREEKRPNYFLKFLSQFKDVMVLILLVAAVVSLFFALHNHSQSELVDSIIIFGIVLLNAILGFSQEVKAENALENLKKMSSPDSLVCRGGKEVKVKTSDLVVGDIVLLEAGDIVPADIYILSATSLKCDESVLTGESGSTEKSADRIYLESTPLGERKNMCFASTTIVYGHGVGVVVATGHDAEIGKIASLLQKEKEDITPLQKSLNKLGEIITFSVLAIAIVIFLVDVIFAHHGYIDSFLTAVAIAVAAIPESLPAVVTIILSIGVTRLAKKNAIIKKLHAVETLGCCEVICSDKTGTITQNKMSVREIFFDGKFQKIDNIFSDYEKVKNANISSNALLSTLSCMSNCHNVRGNKLNYVGDPTEIALCNFLDKVCVNLPLKRISELPFDSNRKLMSTLNGLDGENIQFTKGALDMLLPKCDKVLIDGKVIALDEIKRKSIMSSNSIMGKKALRVLAFAIKKTKGKEVDESSLIFVGMVGMIDPPKKEVKQSISKCKRAGMRVVMITGDHKDTASAIAKELGIIENDSQVMTGLDLDKLSDKGLEKHISNINVFARVSPEHKVRIVKALKRDGKIVAMTGDGVNDAPSVKSASIGIGMGKSGTEVTKSVSDLILADDNFATIVVAVEEGRRIFNNIKKTIQFLLSCNIAEVLSIFTLTMLFPTHSLFNAVQILFINLVTDTLPSIALGVDSKTKSVMSSPPRDPKQNILSGRTMVDIIYQGVWQTVVAVGVYLIGLFAFHNQRVALTMAFLTINMVQLFHMFNVRTTGSIFKDKIFSNKLLNISFAVEALFLFAITAFAPLATLIGLVSLNTSQWFVVVLASFSIIPFCELVKMFQRNLK